MLQGEGKGNAGGISKFYVLSDLVLVFRITCGKCSVVTHTICTRNVPYKNIKYTNLIQQLQHVIKLGLKLMICLKYTFAGT